MLKKVCVALGLVILTAAVALNVTTYTYAQDQVPSYAKWGKMAVKETILKYPSASIIDYLHVGSEIKDDSTIEHFKLWLKDESKEFGVFVNIEYATESGKLITIEFKETTK